MHEKSNTETFHFISTPSLVNNHEIIQNEGTVQIIKSLSGDHCLYQFSPSFLTLQQQKQIQELTNESLSYAVENENELLIKQILACSDIAFSSPYFYSDLIQTSIRQGNLSIFNQLISDNRFVSDRDPDDGHYYIIQETIRHNRLDMFNELLSKQLVFQPGELLEEAAWMGLIDFTSLMLADPPRFITQGTVGKAIWTAAAYNKRFTLQILLANEKATVTDWVYSLIAAAKSGHLELVDQLLLLKTNHPGDLGDACLYEAVYGGHFNVVVRLLQDPRFNNPFKYEGHLGTPFGTAAYNGDFNSLELFLKDPRISSKDYHDAVHCAILGGRTELVKFFLQHFKIQLDYKSNLYIESAALLDRLDIVEHLLTYQELEPSAHGNLALCTAVENRSLPLLKLLINDKRVDPNIPDRRESMTPLQIAVENGYLEVVKFFVEETNINSTTITEAICTAIQQDQAEATAILLKHDGIIAEKLVEEIADQLEVGEYNLDLLKMVIGDPRVARTKSLNEWDEVIKPESFKNKEQYESVRLIIIKLLGQDLWKKIMPFHFFKPKDEDLETELLIELKNNIYTHML